MIISLLAIALVMVASWLFGIFCDRLFIKWFDSLYTSPADPEIDLFVCKTCIYRDRTLFEEPCISCNGDFDGKWEKDNR